MKRRHPETGRGLVFNIQRFSLHDGEGIRTLIFLKGCPLKCKWCSNPEGQSSLPELAFNEEKCLGTLDCGLCVNACPKKAIEARDDEKVRIDRMLCNVCSECATLCPSQAMTVFGKWMSIEQVLRTVEEDGPFYYRSGGGLTIGGGEPLSQAEFVSRLLQEAQGRGLHTAVETSGYCEWEKLESVCRHVSQLFFDIKCMDPERHRYYTGVRNERILENFRRVCSSFPEIELVARTPVIPGFNDTTQNINAIVIFLNTLARSIKYELLPYHGFGEPKYSLLEKEYVYSDIQAPSEEHLMALREVISSNLIQGRDAGP